MNKTMLARIALAITLLSAFNSAVAQSCNSRSGCKRALLLELLTSEGCSSCPPADRWLAKLVPVEFSISELVPLAFHVDDWDYRGWRDPYASSTYTARQYAYVKMRAGAFAYTPQGGAAGENLCGLVSWQQFQQ